MIQKTITLISGENHISSSIHTLCYAGENIISLSCISSRLRLKPNLQAIVLCTCKQGLPTGDTAASLTAETALSYWPGVTGTFAHHGDNQSEIMMDVLRDDIESGHSKSDVENPETNLRLSFCLWSDREDLETQTLGAD